MVSESVHGVDTHFIIILRAASAVAIHDTITLLSYGVLK